MTPLVVATSLRRIHKIGVLGAVTLRVPQLRVSLYGCLWLAGDRLLLPTRDREPGDFPVVSHIFLFDNTDIQQRFERADLAALHRLIKATAR
jgi:hypothetical protein